VSPLPTPLPQAVSFWIASELNAPARAAGLRVYQDVNLRLRPGRIPGRDLVIGKGINPRELVIDASAVHLVGEIVSPSNAAADRVKKMAYYAEAGIPWYLIADPRRDLVLQLYRLVDAHFVLDGEGHAGEPLLMTAPVVARLDPADLEL
jgi:Uma2 family endonuclease